MFTFDFDAEQITGGYFAAGIEDSDTDLVVDIVIDERDVSDVVVPQILGLTRGTDQPAVKISDLPAVGDVDFSKRRGCPAIAIAEPHRVPAQHSQLAVRRHGRVDLIKNNDCR